MDKSPNITASASSPSPPKRSQIPTTNPQRTVTHAGQQAHAQAQTPSNPLPTLARESTSSSAATVNPRSDPWPSSNKLTSQTTSATSAAAAPSSSSVSRASSVAPSPFASRESSPTRPANRAPTTRNPTAASSRAPSRGPAAGGAAPRSRKNSFQDPSRSTKPGSVSLSTAGSRTLSSATTPTFLPAATDRNVNAPAPPSKSPTANSSAAHPHPTGGQDPLKWPVSSRLRSPPPIVTKPPILGPPRRQDQTPDISPSTALPRQTSSFYASESQSDTDADDLTPTQPGARTPARAAGGSTSVLETVQEVSPFGSPRVFDQSMEERLGHRLMSEATVPSEAGDFFRQKELAGRSNSIMTESGAEDATPIEAVRRSGSTSAPPLTSRQSSLSVRPPAKGKPGEASQQSMTVEAETVTSIPQVALAPGGGVQPSSLSLRTKPSTETIRPPKKEKKRTARKQPNMTAGTGETTLFILQPRLRHHQATRSVSSATEMCTSPTKYYHGPPPPDEAASRHIFPSRSPEPRSQTSSKADIFEAKVASAIEETNSSDSDETFVYDSNPPDHPRPPRYHSRTPSAASMVSQMNRADMRSIHSAMMNVEQPIGVKRSMKFVNSYNPSINESVGAEDDGKSTTGRSTAGSARGTSGRHHHYGRWGRNGGGNGHASLFAEQSPFSGANSGNNNSRPSSGVNSPRYLSRSGPHAKSSRGTHLSVGYDLDDNATGADDETTPLIQSGTVRSSRSARSRRNGLHSLRSMESGTYRQPPSFLNRFASCLVLTVMLLLVVSGAIGFMFATSQPLTDIELISMDHVVASEQELMLDLTIRAKNPNVVVVVVDAADIEVFAKSPHAGTDSEWYRTHPGDMPPLESHKEEVRISRSGDLAKILDDPPNDQPPEESSPNMRLGTITGFNSALTFEGSFFHQGLSTSMGEVRLKNPGNVTVGGTERWERIIADDFQLIIKGVLKYTLPLSQRVRTAAISGKTTVKANAANDRDLRKPPEEAKPIEDVGGGSGGRTGGDDNDHDNDVSISFQ
ncbi:vacuolar segregation subunit 7-domain-containing protein [Neurospora hispaniola]|uniref:Vacuolar segregation subunit 7-domain-containing protein n=1 Tax=Neurospora hispaniola TaxID=588809 RepID=A0AAJ0IHA5_9PEZI|nr:vacuolar segregation subunit 7-domain-containing protein [Neurospora hispaniola]